MKTLLRLSQWILLMLFTAGSIGGMAQQPYPNEGDQPVCIGSTQPYGVTPTAGSHYAWSIVAGTGGAGTIIPDLDPLKEHLISVNWTSTGNCTLKVIETNAAGCVGAPVTILITVNASLPVSVTIVAGANPVCAGTAVTYTATPTNGGAAPVYDWYVNGSVQAGHTATFSYTPANNDQVYCVLTSNVSCPSGPATSNTITMTVNASLPVSVTIAAGANPVCAGTAVTYTATPTNGGAAPVYDWYVNGSVQAGHLATFSYTPANTDQVYCVLTSNATCATGNPATSNTVTMTVNASLPVSVAIAANANPVCLGTAVTFTATPTNGGAAPVYDWYVNGSVQAGHLATFSYTPANTDQVYCVLTSDISCASGNPATSNTITMTVNASLPVSVAIAAVPNPVCAGTAVTFTATPTNGGAGPVYDWYVNGSVQAGHLATFSYTPANTDQVYCVLTSNVSCASGNPATSNTITMTVNALPATSPIYHN